jgi:hypothetical protein
VRQKNIFGIFTSPRISILIHYVLKKVFFLGISGSGLLLSKVLLGYCYDSCKVSAPTDKGFKNGTKNRKTNKKKILSFFTKS